jgi:GTP-binding protein Era
VRCGFVAIVGRPSVGKSSLLNRLVGQKLSITSPKPQTTRHAIRGIVTGASHQTIFVDTPGYQTRHRNALNRVMTRSITQTLADVDVVVFVVEVQRFGDADRALLPLLPVERPVVLAINKIDQLERKDELLPIIERLSHERDFAAIVPVSAAKGVGIERLLEVVVSRLPEAPPLFGKDQVTDRSERFLAAEFLREKLFRHLGEELPYGLTVEIERFEEEAGPGGGLRRINAAVVVDRASHKAIVIGRGGAQLKAVASEARRDLESLFGGRVFLEVWVKVRGGWADDERALRSLGYE